jgi:hypothetical protein
MWVILKILYKLSLRGLVYLIRVRLVSMKYFLLLVWVIFGLSIQSRAEKLFEADFYGKKLTAEEIVKINRGRLEHASMMEYRWRFQDYIEAREIVFDKTLEQKYPDKLKIIQSVRQKLSKLMISYRAVINSTNAALGAPRYADFADDLYTQHFIEGFAKYFPDQLSEYKHPELFITRSDRISTQLNALKINDWVYKACTSEDIRSAKEELVVTKSSVIREWNELLVLLNRLPTLVAQRVLIHVEDRMSSDAHDGSMEVADFYKTNKGLK